MAGAVAAVHDEPEAASPAIEILLKLILACTRNYRYRLTKHTSCHVRLVHVQSYITNSLPCDGEVEGLVEVTD